MRQKDPHTQIEQIIKCSSEDQDFLLRYFARKTLSLRLEIEKRRKKIFHMLGQETKFTDNNLLSLAALIISIRYFYNLEKKFINKSFDELTLTQIRDLTTLRLKHQHDKQHITKSPKRQKLLHYWAVVKLCRTQKNKPMSFVNISEYLHKNYNFKISHNEIAKTWKEIELDTHKG